MHGLRGTAVVRLRRAGGELTQIADGVSMDGAALLPLSPAQNRADRHGRSLRFNDCRGRTLAVRKMAAPPGTAGYSVTPIGLDRDQRP